MSACKFISNINNLEYTFNGENHKLSTLDDLNRLKKIIQKIELECRDDWDEPLLTEPENEFDYFNFEHEDIADFARDLELGSWTAGEVDLSSDYSSFQKELSPEAQYFLENTVGFFFSSDGIVFNNLDENFADEMKWPEVRRFFAFQATNELVHSESYGLQLEAIIKDSARLKELQNAITRIPTISKKAQWAQKWMTKTRPLAERILAFICVEGIFFSSSFASIYWLKSTYPGKFEGITNYNDMIARDEGLHTRFGCHLYKNYILHKCSIERIYEIFKEALDIEIDFTTNALPCSLLGINSNTMIEHIKSVANDLLSRIEVPVLYPDIRRTPFSFMNLISLDPRKNIFETRVTEYQRVKRRNVQNKPNTDRASPKNHSFKLTESTGGEIKDNQKEQNDIDHTDNKNESVDNESDDDIPRVDF